MTPGNTIIMIVTLVLSLGLASSAQSQKSEEKKPPTRSKEWKIQNAMSAAPAAIAKNATILDWPAKESDQPPVLRRGTNGWICFPDDPTTPGNDPMCLDKTWLEWAQAWIAKKDFKATVPGIGYMLQGGSTASNTDPFATKASAGGEVDEGSAAHDGDRPGKLDPQAHSSDPHSGGPWIMWGGTPYEHLMVPIK